MTPAGDVWCGERDGTISIRSGATAAVICNAETSSLVWSLALVGKNVWCGTERGPIAIYNRSTRKLVSEARHHSGGVYCITPYPAYSAVWTGSNDFTCNMWTVGGQFRKLFSGHTGGVRSIVVVGPHLWTGRHSLPLLLHPLPSHA